MKWGLHLCYRSFLNTATQEKTSLYFVINVLHIDIMKGKTFMTLSQNWKNLVQNENLVNISEIKNEPSNWNITLSSNGTPISYKIDTGAQCNVTFVESLENISPKPDRQPVNVKLFTYNGSKIPVVGKCSLTLDHKSNYFKVKFFVVDSDSVPILGLKTSKHLQLIKRICRI